jgi:hypothetical protein
MPIQRLLYPLPLNLRVLLRGKVVKVVSGFEHGL